LFYLFCRVLYAKLHFMERLAGRLLEESAMSEETLAIFITVLVIVLMFVWVPVLEFICPPCGRVLERFRSKKRHEVRQGGPAEIKSRARIM
jgi:hypothetical protein